MCRIRWLEPNLNPAVFFPVCFSPSGSHEEDELLPGGRGFHPGGHAGVRTQSAQRFCRDGGAVPQHPDKVSIFNPEGQRASSSLPVDGAVFTVLLFFFFFYPQPREDVPAGRRQRRPSEGRFDRSGDV